jgi:3-oxoacyl-[acyl-carrier protein] reductase
MDHESLPLGGRVALVTGAGRGLGAGIARALAGEGYAVVVNDLPTSAGAPEVVADIRAGGGTAQLAVGDASDFDDVQRMVAEVGEQLGAIDVFVANASGPQPVIELPDLSWRDVEAHLALFVRSPMLITQAILPAMRSSGRGRIVLIGSDLVDRAVPGWSAYAAAKAAMLGLTRTWARELGPYGITVNLVAPGWIPVERHEGTSEEAYAGYLRDVPLDHMGTPEDIAAAVAYLASDGGRFVTGQQLSVNGGRTFS